MRSKVLIDSVPFFKLVSDLNVYSTFMCLQVLANLVIFQVPMAMAALLGKRELMAGNQGRRSCK